MKLTIPVIAVLAISLTSAGQSAPNKNEWGEKFNSNGATLTFKEIGRGQANGQTIITYNLYASGLPKNVSYGLWNKIVGSEPRALTDAYINNDGKIVNVLADPARNIAEDPINIKAVAGMGEPKLFAVISDDGMHRAFAQVIPFPIERKSGPCQISVVMLAKDYAYVQIRVTGLQPGEELQTDANSEEEAGHGAGHATDQGIYDALVGPEVRGKVSGKARFTVTAKSCTVGIEFPWGQGSYHLQ